MVQGQHQVVFLLAGLDQARTQQRPGFQVERRVCLMISQSLQARLTVGFAQRGEILPIHAQPGLRRNVLISHTIDARKRRAQGFVTHDQRLQRRLETPHVQHATQTRHPADVVGRAVRFHLPQEPHALLGIGQRHGLAAVDLGDDGLLVALARGLDQADLLGKRPQFTGVEQGAQRQFHITGLAGAGDDLRGQQRVAAEGEEVIAQTNAWQAENFAPDRGDLLLQRRFGFDVFTHLPHRRRQCAAVQLAAGAQRHGVQAHQQRGHHVLRQLRGQGGFDLLFVQVAMGSEVANQLPVTHQHHSLSDALQGEHARLDFFRLHTEAAQLDLLVETPEVLDHTVGAPTGAVTGAVQAGALVIGDKTLSRQPGAAKVTPGQADTADAQLTRHAQRHGVELLIQHAADHVAQWPTNRRALAVFCATVPVGHVDRGFGRAITVMQLHGWQLGQNAVAQFGGQGFPAREQAPQAGAFGHQRFVDKQLQQRRHEVQRGHAVFLHQLRDPMRVAMLTGPGQYQAAPSDQRPEAFPHRHVETDRCLLHQHVGFVKWISGLHPLQALGQRGMGDAHAFGLAGGTGGVDHVGEVITVQMQAGRLGGPTVQVQAVHGDDAHAAGSRHLLQQRGLGQQQVNAAVLEHVGQALGGVIRVQRHVSAPGLDDRQQADQQLRRTFGGDGHAHVRADAFVTQVMGQAVGLGVQLGEGQAAAVPDQRGGVRGLLVEQFGQPHLGRCAGCFAVKGLFVVLHQHEVADGLPGLFADGVQQVDVVLGEALDGRAFEQFIGIVERQAQAPVAVFFGVQLQIELGFAAVPRQLVGEHARQAAQGAEVALLVVEHDLEQALLAGLREGLQQLFEWQILMGLGAQRSLACRGQQFSEGQAPIQLGAQHQGVDEEADQALGFLARAVGVGHADADIALAAVTVEHALEGCQQQHERGGLVGPGGLANGFAEARAKAHSVA